MPILGPFFGQFGPILGFFAYVRLVAAGKDAAPSGGLPAGDVA